MCIDSADCDTVTGNRVGDGTGGGKQISLRGGQQIGIVLATFKNGEGNKYPLFMGNEKDIRVWMGMKL